MSFGARASSYAPAGVGWTPADLPDLALWANETSTFDGSGWADLSGNGRTLAISAGTPSRSTTINGIDAIAFASGSDRLAVSGWSRTWPETVIAVLLDSGSNGGIISAISGGERIIVKSGPYYVGWNAAPGWGITWPTGDTAILDITFGASGVGRARVNNNDHTGNGTSAFGETGAVGFQLNNGTSGGAGGISKCGEVIICDSALSSGDLDAVRAYLAAKWGVSL